MNEPDIFPSRDTTHADLVDMMDLIATGKVDPAVIPAKIYPFDQAPTAYKDLIENKLMRIVFKWT